jgi:hypothetical protein
VFAGALLQQRQKQQKRSAITTRPQMTTVAMKGPLQKQLEEQFPTPSGPAQAQNKIPSSFPLHLLLQTTCKLAQVTPDIFSGGK